MLVVEETYAVVLKETDEVVGSIGLMMSEKFRTEYITCLTKKQWEEK